LSGIDPLIEHRLKEIEAKAIEAREERKTLQAHLGKINSWLSLAVAIGTGSAVAIAILFGWSWRALPQKAVGLVDEQVGKYVENYLDKNPITSKIDYSLKQDGREILFRSGTVPTGDWRLHRKEGGLWAKVDIDLTQYGDYRIFLTLRGEGRSWNAYGPSVYPYNFPNKPSSFDKGFRVYILRGENLVDVDKGETILKIAEDNNWMVDWLVVGTKEGAS